MTPDGEFNGMTICYLNSNLIRIGMMTNGEYNGNVI